MRPSTIALLIGGLAGCYSPSAPLGVPCTGTPHQPGACPEDQICRNEVCVPTGTPYHDAGEIIDDTSPFDARIDARTIDGPPDDIDGDGIKNASDNCPDLANADQDNEDADALGDVCDPCPPNANNTDTDQDGVGDLCDPNPNVGGDTLVLFEGFQHGVPVSWEKSGTWDAVAGGVRVTAPLNTVAYLALPVAPTLHGSVFGQFVVESLAGNNDNDFGIDDPYHIAGDEGIGCELYQPSANNGARRISLFDYVARNEIGQRNFSWVLDTAYVLEMTRNAMSYLCSAFDVNGTRIDAPGTSNSTVQNPKLALRAYATTGHVNWVMVIASP